MLSVCTPPIEEPGDRAISHVRDDAVMALDVRAGCSAGGPDVTGLAQVGAHRVAPLRRVACRHHDDHRSRFSRRRSDCRMKPARPTVLQRFVAVAATVQQVQHREALHSDFITGRRVHVHPPWDAQAPTIGSVRRPPPRAARTSCLPRRTRNIEQALHRGDGRRYLRVARSRSSRCPPGRRNGRCPASPSRWSPPRFPLSRGSRQGCDRTPSHRHVLRSRSEDPEGDVARCSELRGNQGLLGALRDPASCVGPLHV